MDPEKKELDHPATISHWQRDVRSPSTMSRYNPYDRNPRSTFNFSDTTSVVHSVSKSFPSEPASEKTQVDAIPDEKITSVVPHGPLPKLQDYFDRAVPPRKRYFGHSRKYCLWVGFAVVSAVFVFILGVSVAATRGRIGKRHDSFAIGAIQKGKATHVAAGLGVCGQPQSRENMTVAIGEELWLQRDDGTPSHNKQCGRQILVTQAGNKTVHQIVTVIDRCAHCEITHLELSDAAFSQFAPLTLETLPVQWHFLD